MARRTVDVQVAAGPRFQVLRCVVWIHEARAIRGLRGNVLVENFRLLQRAQLVQLSTIVINVAIRLQLTQSEDKIGRPAVARHAIRATWNVPRLLRKLLVARWNDA